MAKYNKKIGKKKPMMGCAMTNQWGNTIMVTSFLVIIGIVMYYFWSIPEKFDVVGNHRTCPNTIKYQGVEYTHLRGYDQISRRRSGNDISCFGFDILSCNYGRNFYPKTVSRACGKKNKGKQFTFCDQNDLVTVHFDMNKNKPMYIGRGQIIENNPCSDENGVSVDKDIFDNVDMKFGNLGAGMAKKCIEEEDVLSKAKINL